MRRWLLLFLLFLVLVVGAVYALIPGNMAIREEQRLAVNSRAFGRAILHDDMWKKWWPGKTGSTGSFKTGESFTFNGNQYSIRERTLVFLKIAIRSEDDSLVSQLLFVPLSYDSVLVSWEAANGTSYLPHKRFSRYRWLKELQKDWSFLLERLKGFFSNDANIYGIPVRKETVKDSTLISTIIKTARPPGTDTVYRLIDELKNFAAAKGARQTGFPMLNTSKMTETGEAVFYRTQVALPVDKQLQGEGKIEYRWMLGGGKILVAEVKGGPATVSNAFQQMETYLTDHNLVAPAIPFQSLVTDRRREPDTGKWMTRICWPVM